LKKDGNRLMFVTSDGEIIKQFRKAWESNEEGCLDKVMADFPKSEIRGKYSRRPARGGITTWP
jgi:hypothetical protein